MQFLKRASIAVYRLLNQTGLRNKKVFVIGFNKTGSSSIHTLFESLGRPSYHGTKWRGCDDLALFRSYDCFSDGVPKDLVKLDSLFSGSKFILNVRDLDSWVYSRLAHIERRKKANSYKGGPAFDNTEYSIKAWIRRRNAHHLFVLSYFSERPSDILIINFIRDESAGTKICRFLGYEVIRQRPEKNVNPSKEISPKHTRMLKNCLDELGIPECELKYDIYCPSLAGNDASSGIAPDTSMLVTDTGENFKQG